MIDWAIKSITFWSDLQKKIKLFKILLVLMIISKDSLFSTPNLSSGTTILSYLYITIIRAQLYMQIAKMSESATFCLILYPTDFTEKIARIINNPVNPSAIPTKYYEFANVFSKVKAETLAITYITYKSS